MLAAALGALCALALAPAANAQLSAGAATADITPPVGTPMFAYTARSGLANPDRLQDILLQLAADPDPARGLAAQHLRRQPRDPHPRARERARAATRAGELRRWSRPTSAGSPTRSRARWRAGSPGTGITPERLLISATHTHSSTGPIWPPDNLGYAVLGGDLFDPRAFDLTAHGIVEAILRADGRLEPARLGVATVGVTDASRNRNLDPFRRNNDVPKTGGRSRRVDRPGDDRDPGRPRRPHAARRVVELRDPPDLLRRREPAVLGRQRRVRRRIAAHEIRAEAARARRPARAGRRS